MLTNVLALSLTAVTSSTCVPGATLQYQPPGDDGHTYGQEYFLYDSNETERTLASTAQADHQMYLSIGGGSWVFGEDWCYDAETTKIVLLRSPLRSYAPGGGPGGDLDEGAILWIGYTPEE